jgi:hypothetical protein
MTDGDGGLHKCGGLEVMRVDEGTKQTKKGDGSMGDSPPMNVLDDG